MPITEPSVTYTRLMKTDTYHLLQRYRGLENSRLAGKMCRACSDDLVKALQLTRQYIDASLQHVDLSDENERRRAAFNSKLDEVIAHVERGCAQRQPVPRGVLPLLLKLHTRFFRGLLEEQVRVPFEAELASSVRLGRIVIEDCE